MTAEVLLIETHIEEMASSDPIHQGRFPTQLQPEKVQAGFVENQGDLAEEHINSALPLLHNRVKAESATKGSNDGSQDQRAKEADGNSD